MSILTAIMGLVKGVDSDDTEGYLTGGLADSLEKLDTHQHGDGPDGRAVKALAAGAVGLGGLTVAGTLGSSAETDPTSGQGIYLDFNGTRGELFVQNFDTNSLLPLSLNGLVWIYPSGGVFIGASPTDPGAGVVQIAGSLQAAAGPFKAVSPASVGAIINGTGDVSGVVPQTLSGVSASATLGSLFFTWVGAAPGDQIRFYGDAGISVASINIITATAGFTVYGSVVMPIHGSTIWYQVSTTTGGAWSCTVVLNGYQ